MAEPARSLMQGAQHELMALRDEPATRRRWLAAVATVVIATLLMLLVRDPLALDVLTVTLIYLLVCFTVSLTLGAGPAILAVLLSFLADAYFFASPFNSLRNGRFDEVLILVVFLVVAIVGARLVTELRRRTLEAERLAELNRLRGTFVAAVSHDLQTPLTAIRAGLGLLEASAGGQLRPDEAQLLRNVRRNVDHLGLQINDLLTLNQLEAGQFPLTIGAFDLRTVIADAVALTHPLIEQKGQTLEVVVHGPLLIEGDRRHLEQAVVNLVANAHRHTPPGTRITIGARDTPDGVQLQIADDGPGIPTEAHHRIFERFYRAEAATSGSGLGLSIARAIVERHGGRIWVESQPGRGATFFMVLPHQVAKE